MNRRPRRIRKAGVADRGESAQPSDLADVAVALPQEVPGAVHPDVDLVPARGTAGVLAAVMTRDLGAVISQQSFPTLAWTYLFGAMRGFIFKEWKGAGPRARQLILTGIATLVVSTIIIGVGTWIKGQGGGH